MLPNIFISSTISDLHYLRDAVRDTITELGYNPIMSEYGDVGFLPVSTAEDSCYLALKDCQIAIIIIGKRYGSLSANGLSITHNEYNTAKNNNIPIIFLIDSEVISFKRIYDKNSTESVNYPGMDLPNGTFQLLSEFSSSSLNNGFIPFNNVSDIRTNIKKQMAHIFSDLLRKKYDPLKIQVQDVLSEIKTLRHELLNKNKDYLPYLIAMKFMLDDRNRRYRSLIEKINQSLDDGIPIVISSKTFKDYIEKSGWVIDIQQAPDFNEFAKIEPEKVSFNFWSHEVIFDNEYLKELAGKPIFFGLKTDKSLVLNTNALEVFTKMHDNLLIKIIQKDSQ